MVAGMPNISSKFGGGSIYWNNSGEQQDGAIKVIHNGGGFSGDSSGVLANLELDASRCSAVFGNSDTVQPPAIVLIPQIKY